MTDPDAALDRIIATIAERMDCDAVDLDPPLGEVVDAEALVRVAQSDGVEDVAFDYRGRRIEIDGTGRVRVHEPVEV